ncbi:RING-H2 finger protein ATL75 [Ananas comosus]|uniref:RING-H2 finger protein ATL75 n=1 Tax=Ananas comosus TaxID=4615 RepID=A0A199UVY7_ANACO|nr:RING-H2 finger protein ATL75 [Ananas comosus]
MLDRCHVKRQLQAMKIFPYPHDSSATNTNPIFASCLICLEEFVAGEVVRELTACRHLYHRACIDRWLEESWTCPRCQRRAVTHNIIWTHIRDMT